MKLYVIKKANKTVMKDLKVGQKLKIFHFVGKIVHILKPTPSQKECFVTCITILDEEMGVLVNLYTHANGILTGTQRNSTHINTFKVTASDIEIVNETKNSRVAFCIDSNTLQYETISTIQEELIEKGTILKYTLDEKECIVLYISEQGNIICKELNSDKEIVIGANDVQMQSAFNIIRKV